MKRSKPKFWKAFFMLILAVVIFCIPQWYLLLEEKQENDVPQELIVKVQEEKRHVTAYDYSWTTIVDGEEKKSVLNGDDQHPLDLVELSDFLIGDESGIIALEFDSDPDETWIKYWPANDNGDRENYHEALLADGEIVLPADDAYVVMIEAKWENEKTEGVVKYAFGVDFTK